jgi:uncharacterized membrane protein YsdA (DUF1294 family)
MPELLIVGKFSFLGIDKRNAIISLVWRLREKKNQLWRGAFFEQVGTAAEDSLAHQRT